MKMSTALAPGTQAPDFSLRSTPDQLRSRLRFVFWNFPLREIHPHAQHAAEAAEAAADQGRFWEMHDALFGHQSALDDRGTPTFFINGLRHNHAWDLETLFEGLQQASRKR